MLPTNILRVGFVSHTPWIGGAERALVNLLRHLPPGQVKPFVIFPSIKGPLRSEVEELCLPVFDLPYTINIPVIGQAQPLEAKRQEILAFAALFRELELDAVVVNTTVVYPASIAAALSNLPLILHAHGVINEVMLPNIDSAQWYRIESFQVQLADRVIVPAAWVARHYSNLFKLSSKQLGVLPNGTSLPRRDGIDYPTAASTPPQFSMLCTLEPNKGVETFVEAARTVLSRQPNGATFVVYGDDGPSAYRDKLQSLIQDWGLAGSFELRPKQLDVASIYERSRAVIVASHIESFSFVAVEAMSHSRPVIATRCGGPDEIIDEGETGYLIEVGDSHSMADRILRFIENASLCYNMGRAARAVAEARFDIRAIASQYLSTILSVALAPRSREKANSRKSLAYLLLQETDSCALDPTVAGSRQEHSPLFAALRVETVGTVPKNTSLSTSELCESLERLRLRLHEINIGLR